MKILEQYELVVTQALAELGPLEVPADRNLALEQQGRLAPELGDMLFRLCVEHGLEFAPFRETLINILAGHETALVSVGTSGRPRTFAAAVEPLHPVVLLALEMMPGEAFDH